MSQDNVIRLLVLPTAEQHEAWAKAAGESQVAEWLAALADEAAKDRAIWPRIVQLKVPVVFGSNTISSLEFRRGRLSDFKGMKLSGEMPTEQLITIAARLSGQTTNVIERLDMSDAGEVMEVAIDFYGACLGGGKKRSR